MAYSNIKDPSEYFQTALYTGNGGAQSITNDGNSNMQPDWVWVKSRNTPYHNVVFDSSRGVNNRLVTNLTQAEDTGAGYGTVSAFNSDGFSITNGGNTGANNSTFAGWQWKANGGTTSSNTDGNITSTVQVNSDANFSIVTYTGNFTATQTVGHGLGVRPDVVIIKNRSGANDWVVWTSELTSGNFMKLNATDAQSSSSRIYQDGFTTSTFGIGANNTVNKNSNNYVAYCFNNVQGYSKFGKYVGNGSQNGPMVWTGFKPAFVMMKKSSGTGSWHLFDNKRSGYNYANDVLQPNASDAELSGQTYQFVDLLSSGFKVRRATHGPNVDGESYIYIAFAENPFVAGGVPTTAR